MIGLAGSIGTVAFFACIAFCVWIDFLKKKDEREAAHQERLKTLELGYPPLDVEIERAKAYASAAWAAGLIGLLVPLAIVLLTFVGTIVALNLRPQANILVPLVIAWSIAAALVLITVAQSLSAIQKLPRPTGESPQRELHSGKPAAMSSTGFPGSDLE